MLIPSVITTAPTENLTVKAIPGKAGMYSVPDAYNGRLNYFAPTPTPGLVIAAAPVTVVAVTAASSSEERPI